MAWHKILDARRPFDPSVRVPVNWRLVNLGNSYSPSFARLTNENGIYYYPDKIFYCRDCGWKCVWTAENQKWWYEVMRGFIETTAIRCRACRIKERERKAQARRLSEEGRRRKLARLAGVAE